MSTRFFTNEENNTLLKKFEGVFTHNPDIERFDALVGYLRASGYFAIRPHCENVPKIRILVGINVDEIVESYSRRGQLFLADSGAAIEKFRKALREDIQQSTYSREVEEGIVQFTEDVISGKIEIKAHPTKNLHAKIYIFLPSGFNQHKPGAVITGSSNLTAAGLGTEDKVRNYEFNVVLHDFDDVEFASTEFNRLWEEGVSILPTEIQEIREKSFLREDITPFQLYIKLLIEYFGAAIEYDPNSEADLPQGFLRLAYQMDAVSQGFHLLQKHRGFFLADVVGLGKTVIATLIAKKFFYQNGFPNHISSTLIIVPPALKENWETFKEKFELKETEIITCGSLHKIRDPRKYDLIIVDEAHKFRSDQSQGYEVLQKICKSPTKQPLPDGSFAEKRVILVSATPLNNKPDDIRNLLLLFQDGKDSTITGVSNLQRFFSRHQREYDAAMRNPDRKQAQKKVAAIYADIRSNVVEEITIRRTRKDLLETDIYKSDLEKQGINFPKVEAPIKIFYELDSSIESLYDDTVKALSDDLSYNRYRAISHLVPELRQRYKSASLISDQLTRIMKTMLLKRLDSSFHAFRKSLERFRDATEAMVKMFDKGRIFIAPEENVTEYILEGREEELLDRITTLALTDPSVLICKPEDFDPKFLGELKSDLVRLKGLTAAWEKVDVDPKFDEFLTHLKHKLFDPAINQERKLIIFSEAKDTTDYLLKRLKFEGFERLLAIDASNRKAHAAELKANFDANASVNEKKDDIDIVITTEVLAEGVNLHRSNILINYDTPWNSTRLMQRVGRVNRIGSTAPKIYIYNFFPTAKVDQQIALEKKALLKLQAFHSALGEDSQIYSQEEEIDNFGLFEMAPEEERDERLEFLDELRRFRRDHIADFKMIRNLPLRARVGRKDADRAGSTITFVRNARRDAFYHFQDEADPEELGFVEAARIFRAGSTEKPRPLPELHHAHVCAAVENFRQQLASEAVAGQTSIHQIGPTEKKALSLLAALQQIDLASPEEKEILQAGAEAIRNARFDPMRRRLVKIANDQKKEPKPPAKLLDNTLEVLRKFPLSSNSESGSDQRFSGLRYQELLPSIILSESFVE